MKTIKTKNINYSRQVVLLVLSILICFSLKAQYVLTDKEIRSAIQSELIVQSGVDWNNINVDCAQGIVTLTGIADHIMEKERAAKIVKTVKGVRAVIDQVKVKELDITDQQLGNDVRNALFFDPATESYEVTVLADNGEITLSGNVDSWHEKQLAAKVAKSVNGVQSLVNNIEFEYKEDRPDYEIKNEIVKALRWDKRVDDSMIDVAVKNGEVTLSGTVGSAAELSQAELKSWVAGVNDVDTKKLTVEKWARDEDLRKNKYVVKTDEQIKQAVKDALVYDPRVFSFNIDIEVNNGKVTLRGRSDNLKAKNAAERDAKNVVGVNLVDNFILVQGEDIPSDETIEKNIASALKINPYVVKYNVDVDVDNGKVTLNGYVDDYYDKYEAGDIASTATGVKNVENNIVVSPSAVPYVYDYDYSYYYPYSTKYYSYNPKKSDWEIENEINEQIYWSSYVDLDNVDVNVNDGVAELSGTVDTWSEYYHAEINALDGGALAVDNNLVVTVLDQNN